MTPRKVLLIRETVNADGTTPALRPVTRAIAVILVRNPALDSPGTSLDALAEMGALLAERYLPEAIALLPGPVVAYGKAAIVGIAGEVEHGAAILHPRLGKPMRAAVGGGDAIIPSNVKVAAPGMRIDVPLGHKDDVWSFNELDTVTVGLDDAPRPDELLIAFALSDGGRPHPRIAPGRSEL